jgi:Zn/Cd-binding protein ZinT
MTSRNRTRITIDGKVVELLKDGQKTYYEYDTETEALNQAKTLIDEELAEQ